MTPYLVLTVSPPVLVMNMAIQAYSIWIFVDLEHSIVTVNMNIFVQDNSTFLMPKSSLNNIDPTGNNPYDFMGYP